ncbi:MAG: hypothetical protein WCH43_07620, partial [Verrucomicrobiota bacterium]
MQRLLLLIVVGLLGLLPVTSTRAESGDPSDLFLNAYMSVQQAEKLERDGNFKPALAKYRYAASLLEQVQKNSPDWQPLIVDYRKKKTGESITRLQDKMSVQAPAVGPVGPSNEVEPPLPQKGGSEKEPSLTGSPAAPAAPAPDMIDQATREIRSQIVDLQNELKNSKDQLRAVQQQKEDLAKRLETTSKQYNNARVNEAEIKAKLQQAQENARNAAEEKKPETPASKASQDEVARLQNALKEAVADRDAADEQNEEFARRNAKARAMVETARKERDLANQKSAEIQLKFTTAQQQVESISKERDGASQKTK